MSSCRIAVVLAVVLLVSSARADEANVQSAEAYVNSWAGAFVSEDWSRLLDHYDESADTVVILSSGKMFHGFRAIETMYDADVKLVRFEKSAIDKLQVRTFGKTATATFEHRFEFRSLQDDSRWQGHVRTSTVLRHAGDRWYIVLEHSSPLPEIERLKQLK